MTDYIPVAFTIALAAVVVGAMISLNRILGPSNPGDVKGEAFECGNAPTGSAWVRLAVKFYLVGLLFIVFDVEVVFMYPWASIFRELGLFGLVEMMMFVAVLALGFVYAWRKGALQWR